MAIGPSPHATFCFFVRPLAQSPSRYQVLAKSCLWQNLACALGLVNNSSHAGTIWLNIAITDTGHAQ
jgi:hypothetical protein